MKKAKEAIIETLLSILMLLNTIAILFPNGILSKISVYVLTQMVVGMI